MASNRIGRINEEIQRELATQIRSLKDPRVSGTGMVSITRVNTTPDLRYAQVFISVLDKTRKGRAEGLKVSRRIPAAGAGLLCACAIPPNCICGGRFH